MTIRHLKIFITVADCGKMNLAAKELYITQPSISQAIKELETYYGFKLFERLSQKLYITDEGKKLLSYARHIVDSFEMMDITMRDSHSHPKLRIGASVSVGTCLLSDVIAQTETSIPNVDIRVVINNSSFIENMLLNSELDIAIVEGIITSSDLIKIPLCKDELVIVVGKKHPFYNKKYIELTELEGQNIVAREDGSMVRNQFESMLSENNITLVSKWSCTNTEAIKNIVASGKDLSILSKIIVNKEISDGTLKIVPLHNKKVEREIKLVYHRHKYISDTLRAFISITQSLIK